MKKYKHIIYCGLFLLSTSALAQENNENTDKNKQEKNQFWPNAIPVIVAPYFGVDTDTLINVPLYNQDVKILQQRQKLENQYKNDDLFLNSPIVEVSGRIEGLGSISTKDKGGSEKDIDLSNAELDLGIHFNPWVTGFSAISYDNGQQDHPYTRIANSRIYLDRAFLTVGNFNVLPFYFTVGQRYVPFGQYNTNMVNGTFPDNLGKTKARSFLIGYQHPEQSGFYSSVYIFKGDAKLLTNSVMNYGASVGYEFNSVYPTDIGIDYIRNIADSQGMQSTGGDNFKGFGDNEKTEQLMRLIPGIAAHVKMEIQRVTLLVEYVSAIHSFNAGNLSFNGHGAKVWAGHVEAAYKFQFFEKNSSLAIGYDRTGEALGLNLPEDRYISAFNISVWKNTELSLGVQHSKNYAMNDHATAQGFTVSPPATKYSNAAFIKFGAYF